jgi:hypothetical protein
LSPAARRYSVLFTRRFISNLITVENMESSISFLGFLGPQNSKMTSHFTYGAPAALYGIPAHGQTAVKCSNQYSFQFIEQQITLRLI